MRFPVALKHRREKATIYGKSRSYPYYRLAYRVAGKRRVVSFTKYADARAEGERVIRELAAGSQAPALSPREADTALAIREDLDAFKRDTGRTVTTREAVQGYLAALRRLGAHSLDEAVDGFLRNLATVHQMDLAAAVEEFIALRAPLAESKDGKRPARSPIYIANVAAWLRELTTTFPGLAVCDLTKTHLDGYFTSPGLKALASKSRNDRRAAVRMFLAWAVKRDWLPANHRLLEADGMTRESVELGEIDYYRAGELEALLKTAPDELRPMLALCGLAGLRVEEALRLDWGDVWRVPDHVEVSRAKAKGRARRLVGMGPALAAWLRPWRGMTGPVWPGTRDGFFTAFAALRGQLGIPTRDNGLRHAFATYFFALTSNENLVAAAMGNSPGMVHGHYRGLATREEAERWFGVYPTATPANVVSLTKEAVA